MNFVNVLRKTDNIMQVSGYGICVVLTQIQGSDAIFARNLVPWITSFFSLSLTTNVIATSKRIRIYFLCHDLRAGANPRILVLISGRIMWSNYRVRRYRAGYAAVTRWGVVETIVQSAAIYSAALVSLLTTYVSGSNAQYVCLDSLQPLIVRVF